MIVTTVENVEVSNRTPPLLCHTRNRWKPTMDEWGHTRTLSNIK